MKKIFFLIALFIAANVYAAPQRAIWIDSRERPMGTLENPVVTSGGGGALEITTVYGEGSNQSQLQAQSSANPFTYNGNQYVGLWDRNLKAVLCKRATDAATFTCVNYNGIPYAPTFTGAGLNDMKTGGTATSGITATSTYEVEIDATGTPDTYKWRLNGGSYTTGVSITGANQTLSNGVVITFAATTGHTVGNKWTFTVQPAIGVSGDVHQGIAIGVDSDGYMHYNFGTYITEGFFYRRSSTPESISSVTAVQSIDTGNGCGANGEAGAAQSCDDQASYLTFFNGTDMSLYAFFRSNGASGVADTFLWKYNPATTTWARATGTDSATKAQGRFISAAADSRSAYISHPYVSSDNKAHFVWSYRDNTTPVSERGISYVRYDMTNGDFEKADGSAQTIPIRYSNDDSIDNSGEDGLDYSLEGMQYRSPLVVDDDGDIHVVYTKASGAGAYYTHSVGSGLSDLTYTGTVYGFESQPEYEVVITSASTPDVFKWRVNGGAYTTGVSVTGDWQTLSNGFKIKFDASTGHTANDAWIIRPTVGYLQTYHKYHNGTSWSSEQQLTSTADKVIQDHRATLLYENDIFYVLYLSYTEGTGINVLRTTDWTTFSKYAITNFDTGTYSPGYMLLAFDRPAFEATGNFYSMYSFVYDFITLTYSRTPLYLLKWDASSGASVRQHQSYGIVNQDDLVLGSVDALIRPWGKIKYDEQNTWFIKDTDDIETAISSASDGDIVELAAGTYTVLQDIDVLKGVTIKGQGGYSQGCKTTISSSQASINIFDLQTDNIRLEDLCITGSGATTIAVLASKATSGVWSGLYFKDIGITLTGSGSKVGIRLNNASGEGDHVYQSITSSSSSARGLYVYNTSTANAATTFTCNNCDITTSGAATISIAYESTDSSATQNYTLTLRNCKGVSTESGTTTSAAIRAPGDANGIVTVEGGWFSGSDNDLVQASSGVLNVKNAHLANGTTSGTITYQGRVISGALAAYTSTSPTTVKTGTNTACNTTCAGTQAVFGVDDTNKLPLAPTDATADTCVCLGP